MGNKTVGLGLALLLVSTLCSAMDPDISVTVLHRSVAKVIKISVGDSVAEFISQSAELFGCRDRNLWLHYATKYYDPKNSLRLQQIQLENGAVVELVHDVIKVYVRDHKGRHSIRIKFNATGLELKNKIIEKLQIPKHHENFLISNGTHWIIPEDMANPIYKFAIRYDSNISLVYGRQ